jgi:hypothetical protein
MSTFAASIGRRCGIRLRKSGLGPGEVSNAKLQRDVDKGFRQWERRQSPSTLHRIRQPEHPI